MSWDALLTDAGGRTVGSWNYTHNCNRMISEAYEASTGTTTPECDGPLGKAIGPAWWDRLDGATGEKGRAYLADIVRGLESDPERYRAMDPPNGWGGYDTLLTRLREMRNAVPDWPTWWAVSG